MAVNCCVRCWLSGRQLMWRCLQFYTVWTHLKCPSFGLDSSCLTISRLFNFLRVRIKGNKFQEKIKTFQHLTSCQRFPRHRRRTGWMDGWLAVSCSCLLARPTALTTAVMTTGPLNLSAAIGENTGGQKDRREHPVLFHALSFFPAFICFLCGRSGVCFVRLTCESVALVIQESSCHVEYLWLRQICSWEAEFWGQKSLYIVRIEQQGNWLYDQFLQRNAKQTADPISLFYQTFLFVVPTHTTAVFPLTVQFCNLTFWELTPLTGTCQFRKTHFLVKNFWMRWEFFLFLALSKLVYLA